MNVTTVLGSYCISASGAYNISNEVGRVSRAARSTASRFQESHPSWSAAPISAAHLDDHAFVYESRLPESSPDDPPGTPSPTLPVVPKTTAWLPWLRCLPPPDLPSQHKTRAPHCLHGSVSSR